MASAAPIDDGKLFERAVDVWARAKVVFEGPSWENEPEASLLSEMMAARRDTYEAKVIGGVAHENHLVAAYCCLTLERMKSAALRTLPPAVLQRTDKLTWRLGSFSQNTDLGAYAAHKQKVAQGRKLD